MLVQNDSDRTRCLSALGLSHWNAVKMARAELCVCVAPGAAATHTFQLGCHQFGSGRWQDTPGICGGRPALSTTWDASAMLLLRWFKTYKLLLHFHVSESASSFDIQPSTLAFGSDNVNCSSG